MLKLRTLAQNDQRILGVLTCALLGVLYVVSRTEVHTFDALSYTWAVEDKPLGLLFHPHHLFYGPVGWLSYRLALAVGYSGHADLPVQIVNGIAGAVGVFFLWRFGTRWTGRSMVSLGASILVGLSYAYWIYAAEVEVYTLATAFLTLALWIMLKLDEQASVHWAVALGLAHTGSILFHQTNVLFGLAIAIFLLLRPKLRRWSILLAYGLSVAAIVSISYGYVAYASKFSGWQAFYDWFTDYAQSGQWGGFLSLAHFPALRSGLQTAVSPQVGLAISFYTLVAIGLLFGALQAWKVPERRAWLGMSLAWFFTYVVFFWWWEPWNIEFWIAVLPLWALWLLSAWPAPTADGDRAPSQKPRLYAAAAWLYGIAPFVLAVLLFRAHFQPIQELGDASADYYRQVTNALAAVVLPEELVVTRGNVLDLYIPFYAEHPHLLSMRTLEQQKGGDRAQIMGELMGQLDWASVTGRPFLIDQFILDEAREPIRNPFGLLPEEIGEIRTRYDLQPLAMRGEQPLFYGTPRFDNLGQREWFFDGSLLGWSTWGVDGPRFEQQGWCFHGGVDPQMKGPVINLDASTYDVLVLDMTVSADTSTAQLFWRSAEAEYSLDNSLETALQSGRQSYEISLKDQSAWHGVIAQVRLDPIPGVDGAEEPVTACVHSIRFKAAGSN